jgi:hypothetical protein
MSDITVSQEPAADSFSVKLTGDGIQLERNIDQATALEILAVVMGRSAGSRTQERGESASATRRSTARSIREYLDEIEAVRNPDKILGIANFLISEHGYKRVTSADIKNAFPSAGETVPANFPRDLRWAVTNGWLGEDPTQRGAYYVTETGRAAIEERFSADVRRGTGQARRRRTRRSQRRASE